MATRRLRVILDFNELGDVIQAHATKYDDHGEAREAWGLAPFSTLPAGAMQELLDMGPLQGALFE